MYERIESSSTEIWLGDGNFLDFCDEADKFDVDDTYEAQCLLCESTLTLFRSLVVSKAAHHPKIFFESNEIHSEL